MGVVEPFLRDSMARFLLRSVSGVDVQDSQTAESSRQYQQVYLTVPTPSATARVTGPVESIDRQSVLTAVTQFASTVSPQGWPRVFVTTTDSANGGLSRFLEDWAGVTTADLLRYSRLGILQLTLPPHNEFADWLSVQAGVDLVSSVETPVSIVDPIPSTSENLSSVRRITRARREFAIIPEHRPRLCILDTGLDLTHPDFQVLPAEQARDFSGSGNVLDMVGHGTHVAGIAVGNGDASNGRLSGLAVGSRLVVGKVLGESGIGSNDSVIAGLDWAVDADVDIINLSLGSTLELPILDPLAHACERIHQDFGIQVCAAAGNNGELSGPRADYTETISSPAIAPGVIAVGAVDEKGGLADFSARGSPLTGNLFSSKPDCLAPGVGVMAARSGQARLEEDDHYQPMDGTSMACPNVSGALALLMSNLWARGVDRVDGRMMARDALLDSATTVKIGEPEGEPLSDIRRKPGRPCEAFEMGRGLINVERSRQRLGL